MRGVYPFRFQKAGNDLRLDDGQDGGLALRWVTSVRLRKIVVGCRRIFGKHGHRHPCDFGDGVQPIELLQNSNWVHEKVLCRPDSGEIANTLPIYPRVIE